MGKKESKWVIVRLDVFTLWILTMIIILVALRQGYWELPPHISLWAFALLMIVISVSLYYITYKTKRK